MGLFDIFKRSKLTKEEQQWNKMWDMWVNENIDSPYQELMNYLSEINNGGHDQYFFNTDNNGDLQKEILTLKTILPPQFIEKLNIAYEAYLILEDHDDEKADEILEKCDEFFYENEEDIINILKEYASHIK